MISRPCDTPCETFKVCGATCGALVGIETRPETALESEADETIEASGAETGSDVALLVTGFEGALFTTSTSGSGAVEADFVGSETEIVGNDFFAVTAGGSVVVARG